MKNKYDPTFDSVTLRCFTGIAGFYQIILITSILEYIVIDIN